MKGNNGRVERMLCNSSWLSTSKILMLENCPAMRQRWRHFPERCNSWARAFSSAFIRSNRSGSRSCGGRTSICTWYSIAFLSGPRVAAQFVPIQRDADAGSGRQVNVEIREPQRLRHQIVRQDLRAKMLAAPGEVAQGREDLQMSGRSDGTLQQTAPVQSDAGRLRNRRDLARVQQPAVLHKLERDDVRCRGVGDRQHVVSRENALVRHQRHG